jgi:hypothetical protein
MISSSDFTCSSSGAGCWNTLSTPTRGTPVVDATGETVNNEAEPVAASARFSWPPARDHLAVSVQDLMAADTPT